MSFGKIVLFVINVIFVMAGAALCAAGAVFYMNAVPDIIDINIYAEFYGDLQIVLISAMVLGAVVFLISYLGCCGAVKESFCMLTTYSVILIVLAILKTLLIVFIFLKKEEMYKNVPVILDKIFTNENKHFHLIEKSAQCCGVDKNTYLHEPLPPTCCETTPCTKDTEFNMTCSAKLTTFVSHYELTITGITLLIVIFELLAASIACCLSHKSRKENNSYSGY